MTGIRRSSLALRFLLDARHHIAYCETPIPKAKRIGIGKLNNPAKRRVMRLKLQERSEKKFVSRIIPS